MSAFTGKVWAAAEGVVTVTWSFALSAGSYDFTRYITSTPWQDAIRDAFDLWESVANIDFVEASDSTSNDMRLGYSAFDGPYNVIGEATWYSVRNTLTRAEIAFDEAENWTVDGAPGTVNFFATAVHEIGHAIGLSHIDESDSIMYAYAAGQHELSDDDVANIQVLYGARPKVQPELAVDEKPIEPEVSELPKAPEISWLDQKTEFDVVAATYQFFTGSVPTADGFTFLIDSPENENDLTDPYYFDFNAENLFINFSNNLASVSQSKEAFHAKYAALSFDAFIQTVYEEVVGFEIARAAGIDTSAAVSFFEGGEAFYQQISAERGVDVELGAKLAAAGSVLYEATKAGIGRYSDAIDGLYEDLSVHGTSGLFGHDLFEIA